MKINLTTMVVFYFMGISLFGFLSMWWDKRCAKKRKWRVSEQMLITIAALGGSIGSFIGMYTFRHKTQHLQFVIGVPVIVFLQMIVVFSVIYIMK